MTVFSLFIKLAIAPSAETKNSTSVVSIITSESSSGDHKRKLVSYGTVTLKDTAMSMANILKILLVVWLLMHRIQKCSWFFRSIT